MINKIYPLFITDKLNEVKDFYTNILEFKIVFESDWYIQLDSNSNQIAFMAPDLTNQPEFLRSSYNGNGAVITLEVENIEDFYNSRKDSLKVLFELKTEEWGQTHFITVDPAGIYLDIVQYTSPEDYK